MKLLCGDSLHLLQELSENSIDAVVTDPPYGLKFMGKRWDYDVPTKELWAEVLRVCKPGASLLSFGGTRTYHRMAVAIEESGFEIRDQIQWIYGSGFPKSHNLKDEWAGWGTALKPANEPIVLARKPLSESTVAKNVLKWGVGAINVDGGRIESSGDHKRPFQPTNNDRNILGRQASFQPTNAEGRWPANVIFDEEAAEMLGEPSRFFYCAKASKSERNKGLEGMPEVDFSGGGGINHEKADAYGARKSGVNYHPTVKPIKLMEYLCRLITPPNGIILDPFMGSGSTGVAAINLGFDFIGVEMNEEYFEIAKRRIADVTK